MNGMKEKYEKRTLKKARLRGSFMRISYNSTKALNEIRSLFRRLVGGEIPSVDVSKVLYPLGSERVLAELKIILRYI